MDYEKEIVLPYKELEDQIVRMEGVAFDFWCMLLARYLGSEYYKGHDKGEERICCGEDGKFHSASEEPPEASESNNVLRVGKLELVRSETSPKDPDQSLESLEHSGPNYAMNSLSAVRRLYNLSDGMEREKAADRVRSGELDNYIGLQAIVAIYSTWEVFLDEVLRRTENKPVHKGEHNRVKKEGEDFLPLMNELRETRNCITHSKREEGNLPSADRKYFLNKTSPVLRIQGGKSILLTCKHLEELLDVMRVELSAWWTKRCIEERRL